MSAYFDRSEALLGREALARLASARVLIVGVGGVGSWCAEALVRTGVGHVMLMDDDVVAESNVNRQCPATAKTVGRPKVEVMAERLREINPAAEVRAVVGRYPAQPGLESLGLDNGQWTVDKGGFGPSVIIDAIDSVDCKARLILDAFAAGVPIVSSMGAALRTDPTQVRIRRFEKVTGDGLARALRTRFRRLGTWPGRFSCVCSDEVPRPFGPNEGKGSVMTVTATFGLCLAGEAIARLTEGTDDGR